MESLAHGVPAEATQVKLNTYVWVIFNHRVYFAIEDQGRAIAVYRIRADQPFSN